MADEWDNFNWFEPNAEPQPSTGGGEPNPNPAAPVAAGAGNLKGQSWGNSNAQTGMPGWWQDMAKKILQAPGKATQGLDKMTGAWDAAYGSGTPKYQDTIDRTIGDLNNYWQNTYKQLPGQIENQRQAMINQAVQASNMGREVYQPVLEEMSKRGILNSSVTGDAMGRVQSDIQKALLDQAAGANTWAAGQNLQTTRDMPTVLGNILNQVGGAQDRNQTYGQGAISGAGNIQTLINQFQDFIKVQQSKSNQGSATYGDPASVDNLIRPV
jgi:hypothetical protein